MQKWEYLTLITQFPDEFEHPSTEPEVHRWGVYVNYQKIKGEKQPGFLGGTKSPGITEYLNHLGEQGWELVAVFGSGYSVKYIFKRPVQG